MTKPRKVTVRVDTYRVLRDALEPLGERIARRAWKHQGEPKWKPGQREAFIECAGDAAMELLSEVIRWDA